MNVPTLSEQLLGAWSLVRYEMLTVDGIAQHPLGADAMGLLIYRPDGLMTVQIMARERKSWSARTRVRTRSTSRHERSPTTWS